MKNQSHETTGRKQDCKIKKGNSGNTKGEPASDSKTLSLPCYSDKTAAHALAAAAVKAEVNAAFVMMSYADTIGSSLGITEVVECLQEATAKIKAGDMTDAEAMLYSQAMALQTIFIDLSRRAANQKLMDHYQTFLTLALKAQSQSRSTLQALTELKFPRQVIMKQTNVANGAQQINNSGDIQEPAAARTPENKNLKNKLSPQIEDTRYERETLDFGTTTTAGRPNPELVPVGKINRTKDRSR
jgi:hypothetical protein